MKDYKVKNKNIELIEFESVLAHWSEYLWPNRDSEIKPMSSMVINDGANIDYDMSIYQKYTPIFLGYYQDNTLVGVNSGHKTSDYDFRSRGLYVDPIVRGQGIGVALLEETVNIGRYLSCNYCWSLPRKQALKTYLRSGFTQKGQFFSTETSDENCYAVATL